MPPKSKTWQTQSLAPTPDFRSTESVVAPAGPKPQTMSAAIDQLRSFVLKTLRQQNLLQLGDDEVKSTAEIIISCTDRAEIFNWAKTLMLPEAFAAEVVKRREDIQRLGVRTDDDAESVVSRASTTSAKKRRQQRGKAMTKVDDPSGGLVEGSEFECGCFATQHQFKANCANCGRIICQQEADDSCYACGMPPSTCLQHEIKLQNGLIDKAAAEKSQRDYEAARNQRDKLLQYARERTKRTVVIDDQSGMYANTAWVSQEERDASRNAEDAQRKKVAELHRQTGAYTVHLDIVNQSTALGACALLQKAEDAITAAAVPDEDAAKFALAPAATEPAAAAPQVPVALRACASPPCSEAGTATSSDSDSEEYRVQPLPSLLQAIFVDGSEASGTEVEQGSVRKTGVERRIAESRRVQTDYYEDDRVTWRVARQHAGDEESPAASPATTVSRRVDPAMPAAEEGASADTIVAADETERPTATASSVAAPDSAWRRLRHKDDGMCLSMHQPWASLLVAGIKTHEGRSWGSDFRGRLWIHAAAAKPSHVEEVEARYRPFAAPGIDFPSDYPTSCLLGYVVVTDVMDRDAYESTFAPSERQETSEYKFICTAATPLPFLLSMDGKHKLFKLEKKLWLAARKQLGEGPPK